MRPGAGFRVGVVAGLVALAAALQGQQPAGQQPPSQRTPVPAPPIVIFRIDLVQSGSVFAMNEPVLDGDDYVYKSLPERTEVRLPKSKVKEIVRRTTDYDKIVIWQVDVAPSGSYLTRDQPVKKGKNWVAHAWKQGQLMSVPQADVRKITRLTGFDAFRAQELALGVVVLQGDSMTPGFRPAEAPPPGAPAPGAAAPQTGNWTYQGAPGSSDAYAPGNAVVARPGDVPMAPTPTQPPR